MEDKIFLNKEQLENVSGGAGGDYAPESHVCPKCGSDNVTMFEEAFDAGHFVCEDCGCKFYADV